MLLKGFGHKDKDFENKSVNELTKEDKIKLIYLNSSTSLQSNTEVNEHCIYEQWNLFLRFLHKNQNRVTVDKPLKKLIKKYPKLLEKDPF